MMVIHHPSEQQFVYITESTEQAGRLAYRYLSEQIIDVFTTQVKPEFQGQGIAGELYNAVIAFAQENGLKIKPSCSYIEVKMARNHPDLIS